MKMPQATAKPVRAVRNLLRRAVLHISLKMSFMGYFIIPLMPKGDD